MKIKILYYLLLVIFIYFIKKCPENVTILFGSNPKARLAARTLFSLTHMYGDIIREGWSSIFDIILQLYKCNLLPTILVEVIILKILIQFNHKIILNTLKITFQSEDFLELSGKVSLIRESVSSGSQKSESSLFSSLYSYIASGGGMYLKYWPFFIIC